jgi:hypothetical protein
MMENKSPNKFIRVTVYISQDEYRTLRSKLALKGLTISEWFRRAAKTESEDV